jgi:hypothetical protein
VLPRTDTIRITVTNGYYSSSRTRLINVENATDIDDPEKIISYNLNQNFPNPFNPSTQISFTLPKSEFVNVSVYNLIGEKIYELVNENLPSGSYTFKFDGNNLQSGIYFARLNAGSYKKTIKMTLLK